MANMKSIEYGIVIEGCSYKDLTAVCEHCDSFGQTMADFGEEEVDQDQFEFIKVHDRIIETHPFDIDYIFISFGDLSYGQKIPEMHEDFADIKARLEYLVAQIKVKWDVICTER